jgi:RimJ/RimL family protein N-acetyltransferase
MRFDSAWGNGFGIEMALAVLRYGFVDLNLPRIAGMASLQNYVTARAAEDRT